MLVSVSGPPAAGKTTLCRDLVQELGAEASLLPDLPRHALERLDPALESWNEAAFQHYVGYAQMLAEQDDGGERVRICDKSLIDALAYWDILFEAPRPRWADAIGPHRYALVLLCEQVDVIPEPQSLQGVHLGLRDSLARRIDEIARGNTPRAVMLSGSRQQRLAIALLEIKSLSAAAGAGSHGTHRSVGS